MSFTARIRYDIASCKLSYMTVVLSIGLLGCECRQSTAPRIEADSSITTAHEQVDAPTSHRSPVKVLEAMDQLADLIDQRLGLMTDVAKFKWNHQRPVTDPEREAALLKSLQAQATERGVSEQLAKEFVTAQIAAARQRQEKLFSEWKASKAETFESVPDLDQDLRPRITTLTEAAIEALVVIDPVAHERPTGEYWRDLLAQRIAANPTLESELKTAFKPLLRTESQRKESNE